MGNGTEDPTAAGPEGSPKDTEEDWVVECSDDELYNPCGLPGPVWEPRPEEAKALYERLAKGEVLNLQWVCPGRRSPSPEKAENQDEVKEEPEEQKQEERSLPSGFDFDEDMDAPGMKPGFTPRRTPGSTQAPRSKKRVARMDKIMNDILRHKKIEAAERKSTPGRRAQGSPGQRKVGGFGGQRRLLSTLGDRKPPGQSSASEKSFDFDDFGAPAPGIEDQKQPVEVSSVAPLAAAPVTAQTPTDQGPNLTDAQHTTPMDVSTNQKPTLPLLTDTAPTCVASTTVAGSMPESSSASMSVHASTLSSSTASSQESAPASGRFNESLTSQMGTLTCKTEDEIKKEPESSITPVSSSATESSTHSVPTSAPPLPPVPAVEVKQEAPEPTVLVQPDAAPITPTTAAPVPETAPPAAAPIPTNPPPPPAEAAAPAVVTPAVSETLPAHNNSVVSSTSAIPPKAPEAGDAPKVEKMEVDPPAAPETSAPETSTEANTET